VFLRIVQAAESVLSNLNIQPGYFMTISEDLFQLIEFL
jgi:hypothetical protein